MAKIVYLFGYLTVSVAVVICGLLVYQQIIYNQNVSRMLLGYDVRESDEHRPYVVKLDLTNGKQANPTKTQTMTDIQTNPPAKQTTKEILTRYAKTQTSKETQTISQQKHTTIGKQAYVTKILTTNGSQTSSIKPKKTNTTGTIYMQKHPSKEKEKNSSKTHIEGAEIKPIKINVWNKIGEAMLQGTKWCNFTEKYPCTFTTSKEDYNGSDAIFIRAYYFRRSELPTYKLPGQKWVYYQKESPDRAWKNYKAKDLVWLKDKFSVTSTYSLDSTLPLLEKSTQCRINPISLRNHKVRGINFAQNKTRKIAWFVSHCLTESKRELYVKELQKYIPVDIYGRCGNFSCPAGPKSTCHSKMLSATYKFYLSFENAFCDDYITEKLTNVVPPSITVIPVVLGSGNYSRYLPEGTYIDTKNFTSPKKLAEYLLKIDRDDNLFNEFIARKKSLYCYKLDKGNKKISDFKPYFCRLCKHLHDNKDDESTVDVPQYWNKERKCTKPGHFYRNVYDKLAD